MSTQQAGHPRVSVLIAAYNSIETLGETIDSVLAQTYPNVEIVVVDDGSTDATPELLRGYGDRIKVVTKANGGVPTSRNAGLRAASGDYIALLDADDLCRPGRIAAQMAVMRTLGDVALCATEFTAFSADGELSPAFSSTYYSTLAEEGAMARLLNRRDEIESEGIRHVVHSGIAYPKLLFGNFLHPPTTLFPRSTWERNGDFDATFHSHADWPWIARAARFGPVAFIATPLLDYRLSARQLSGPANRARRTHETIALARKVMTLDPEAVSAHRESADAFLAETFLDGADALSDTEKRAAWNYLREGMAHTSALSPAVLKIALKIALPPAVLRASRRLRGSDVSKGWR
ncbi:MAG: glycosyltransferase [Betaproteobacteria bacterium]|nr:glycosyltransferase [Betaproteobacteria bacterium]